MASPTSHSQFPSPRTTIAWAGLIAGTLDGVAAVVHYLLNKGNNPLRVFQYIASGIVGKEAFTGGLPMAILGMVLHFLIAFGWAIGFYLLYRRFRIVASHPLISGLFYGMLVWLLMNQVIVPLSAAPPLPFRLTQALISLLIHLFLVGWPIAWVVHRLHTRQSRLPAR